MFQKTDKQKQKNVAQEMSQWLRMCTAPAEDHCFVPSTLGGLQPPVTTAPGDPVPLTSMDTCPYPCTDTK